jgi:hypothetical protein
MATEILENGWISDRFQIGESPWVFNDAIVMPADQYNALTPDDIAAMKQQRYDKWYAIVTNPPQE